MVPSLFLVTWLLISRRVTADADVVRLRVPSDENPNVASNPFTVSFAISMFNCFESRKSQGES